MTIGLLIDVGRSLTSFKGEIISIDLDVTFDESHEWLNDVVTSPVEVGSPISDHIQPQPDKLTISGMIGNSSISDSVIAQLSKIDESSFETRTQTTFDLLRALMESRKLVTVYTRYRIYTDMALASINIPRSAGVGDAINFTAQFTHVRIVETQTVTVPGISNKKGAKAGGKGGSTARKTDEQATGGKKDAIKPPTSVIRSILDGVGVKSFDGIINGVDVTGSPGFSIYKTPKSGIY
ncbi:MAG: hypothetical protein Q8L39_15270 [Burkholderiales bacterium]|nr:hypothetical protein [Burkholderiales bacterium]